MTMFILKNFIYINDHIDDDDEDDDGDTDDDDDDDDGQSKLRHFHVRR